MTSQAPSIEPQKFRLALVGIVGTWAVLAWTYAIRFPLIADEFQGAHSAAQLLDRMPYRDFAPYKTVLGYLMQLPVLWAIEDPWSAVVGVRIQLVGVAALALLLTGLQLRRHFSGQAVLAGLFLLLASSTFTERAGELRVDMLTAWMGLGSLLFLFRGRWGWAGAAAALSFFVSQKGAYFAVAGGAGILAMAPILGTRETARAAGRYIGSGVMVALAYLLVWSLVAPFDDIIRIVFVGPAQIAGGDLYRDIPGAFRRAFWWESIRINFVLYGAAAAGLWAATRSAVLAFRATTGDEEPQSTSTRQSDHHHPLLLGYAATLIALYLLHRQPWPYYIATLGPTLGVLAVSAIDQILNRPPHASVRRLFLPAALALGCIPLFRIPTNLAWRSTNQSTTVRRLDALLEPGDHYLAGVHLLPRGSQAPAELTWLDRRTTARLAELSSSEVSDLTQLLDDAPIKLFVHTGQLSQLPAGLQEVLLANFLLYEPYLYVYAPTVVGGESEFTVHFAGRYLVEATAGASLLLDGQLAAPGNVIELDAGGHASDASDSYRLRFLPNSPPGGPQERPPLPFFSRSMTGGLTTWADQPSG